MILTVTTTVSTIVSSSAVVGLLASLGAAAVITLVGSLSTKVIFAGAGNRLVILGRNLDTVILPLLFVLSFIVFMNVWQILP